MQAPPSVVGIANMVREEAKRDKLRIKAKRTAWRYEEKSIRGGRREREKGRGRGKEKKAGRESRKGGGGEQKGIKR